MHPEADPSKDKFDELLIPGFGNYLEYSFRHPEYFYQNFARDIVPTQQNYVWTFTAASANSGYDVLSWNNDFFGDNRMNLFLIDFSSGMITDMRKKDNYGFYLSRNREFKILYGTDEFISLQLQGIQLVSGTPYPNPFNGQLYIPLILPSSTAGYDVDLEIFNATGKLVFSQTYKSITDNLNTLTWKGENNNGEHTDTGIYIYKVIVSNTGNTFTGKVVKK